MYRMHRRYTSCYDATVPLSPLATIPLTALGLTIMLHLAALRLFPRWGLLDFPERYGLTRPRLPYPAGILCILAFLALFPFLQEWTRQATGLMVAVVLLGVTSFLDDRTPLSPAVRLSVQLTAALLVFATGDCTGSRVCSVTNPLEGWIGGPIVELNSGFPLPSLIVTVFWLMLTTNALNWFDGIPGQVNLLSTIGFFVIGFLALHTQVNQPQLAMIAFTAGGISLGSLLFDFPPPLVIAGDTGAMFLGFLLGVLTVYAGGKVATAFLVLGVPILDLLFVIIRRIAAGRSPLSGSMAGEHLHHRLLARGWPPIAIIGVTALIGTTFGITALFLNTQGKMLAALLLVCVMFSLSLFADGGTQKS
jgi:UDP-GlcNAc:undecaprenyl-phosphate/decaprenyl-phosphate GlcNAc-1-phosphate transferase